MITNFEDNLKIFDEKISDHGIDQIDLFLPIDKFGYFINEKLEYELKESDKFFKDYICEGNNKNYDDLVKDAQDYIRLQFSRIKEMVSFVERNINNEKLLLNFTFFKDEYFDIEPLDRMNLLFEQLYDLAFNDKRDTFSLIYESFQDFLENYNDDLVIGNENIFIAPQSNFEDSDNIKLEIKSDYYEQIIANLNKKQNEAIENIKNVSSFVIFQPKNLDDKDEFKQYEKDKKDLKDVETFTYNNYNVLKHIIVSVYKDKEWSQNAFDYWEKKLAGPLYSYFIEYFITYYSTKSAINSLSNTQRYIHGITAFEEAKKDEKIGLLIKELEKIFTSNYKKQAVEKNKLTLEINKQDLLNGNNGNQENTETETKVENKEELLSQAIKEIKTNVSNFKDNVEKLLIKFDNESKDILEALDKDKVKNLILELLASFSEKSTLNIDQLIAYYFTLCRSNNDIDKLFLLSQSNDIVVCSLYKNYFFKEGNTSNDYLCDILRSRFNKYYELLKDNLDFYYFRNLVQEMVKIEKSEQTKWNALSLLEIHKYLYLDNRQINHFSYQLKKYLKNEYNIIDKKIKDDLHIIMEYELLRKLKRYTDFERVLVREKKEYSFWYRNKKEKDNLEYRLDYNKINLFSKENTNDKETIQTFFDKIIFLHPLAESGFVVNEETVYEQDGVETKVGYYDLDESFAELMTPDKYENLEKDLTLAEERINGLGYKHIIVSKNNFINEIRTITPKKRFVLDFFQLQDLDSSQMAVLVDKIYNLPSNSYYIINILPKIVEKYSYLGLFEEMKLKFKKDDTICKLNVSSNLIDLNNYIQYELDKSKAYELEVLTDNKRQVLKDNNYIFKKINIIQDLRTQIDSLDYQKKYVIDFADINDIDYPTLLNLLDKIKIIPKDNYLIVNFSDDIKEKYKIKGIFGHYRADLNADVNSEDLYYFDESEALIKTYDFTTVFEKINKREVDDGYIMINFEKLDIDNISKILLNIDSNEVKFDFKEVKYVTSRAMSFIINWLNDNEDEFRDIILRNVNNEIKATFNLLGVDQFVSYDGSEYENEEFINRALNEIDVDLFDEDDVLLKSGEIFDESLLGLIAPNEPQKIEILKPEINLDNFKNSYNNWLTKNNLSFSSIEKVEEAIRERYSNEYLEKSLKKLINNFILAEELVKNNKKISEEDVLNLHNYLVNINMVLGNSELLDMVEELLESLEL